MADVPTNRMKSRGWRTTAIGDGVLGRRQGATGDELRRHNLAVVLTRLHLSGPLSRSELTTRTGLNRSTVADLLGELTALGLVEERPGTPTSGPGRPSPVVRTRPQGAAVLAVEVAVDSLAVATVGLGGYVFNRLRVERPRARFSPQETSQDVAKLAGPLLDSLPSEHVLTGIGVAVVGITRRSDGFVHFAPNLRWRDVPLADLLADELGLGLPILVANEADLGALGEQRRGIRPGIADLVYVSGEVGIGTGVILGGQPLLGAAGYAGEAGHMLINPGARTCRCGAVGCWETEAGETALLQRAGLDGGLQGLDRLRERAAAGEERARVAIAETGRWLGLGVGDLINLFNPELVVLGGLYHRLFDLLEDSVLAGAHERALRAPGAMATIARSGLGTDAPLLGAAEMVLSEVLGDPAAVRTRPAPGRSEGRVGA
jgi:predicted NBD/HSP70 family sugar kinase